MYILQLHYRSLTRNQQKNKRKEARRKEIKAEAELRGDKKKLQEIKAKATAKTKRRKAAQKLRAQNAATSGDSKQLHRLQAKATLKTRGRKIRQRKQADKEDGLKSAKLRAARTIRRAAMRRLQMISDRARSKEKSAVQHRARRTAKTEERRKRRRDEGATMPTEKRRRRKYNYAKGKKNRVQVFSRLGFRYSPNDDYRNEAECGNMDIQCEHCKALKFKGEPPGFCCRNGKVVICPLTCTSPLLKKLYEGSHADAKHFLKNIRSYNAAFQMTSFGADIKRIMATTRLSSYKDRSITESVLLSRRKMNSHSFYRFTSLNHWKSKPLYAQVTFLEQNYSW